MTSRSVIFFRAWVLVLFAGLAHAGTVAGSVDLKRANRSGVVVWLEPSQPLPAPLPSPIHLRMVQKDKKFQPHELVIRAGSTVDFPNADPIFHNAFSNFNGQIFDIGLYPPGKSRSIVFRNPGIVHVFCNIHPTMAAVIVVIETPYYAISDAAGRFAIGDVASGQYRLHVFSERSTPEALNAVSRIVSVREAGLVIPAISILEAGYIFSHHSNKYGKAYPPQSGSDSGYTIPQ